MSVRSLVVVGGGVSAWIAATALARHLKHTNLAVTVLDTGPEAGAPVGRWTLPSQRGVHTLLGIAEPEFLRAARASFRLGSEHRGWQGDDSGFLHVHGEIGKDIGSTPFYKYLVERAVHHQTSTPDPFSIAARAARQGRFARPMGDDDALTSTFTYGFHFDERAYVDFLRTHAAKSGVAIRTGSLDDIERTADGFVTALLSGGDKLAAEVFIDASGSEAKLMSRVDESARIDWSRWLPCDRMLSARMAMLDDAPALTRTRAVENGWHWQAPLADSAMAGFVYSSGTTSAAAALSALRAAAPGIIGEPSISQFTAGRRPASWIRNVIALGSSTMSLEPLAGADLHFAQLGLGTLVELFPLEPNSTVEAREYNRIIGEHADALRDFTLAHYIAGPARSGDLWSAVRAVPPPDTLAEKLDLFSANGRIQLADHESFEEMDWVWLLLGTGRAVQGLEWQMQVRVKDISRNDVAPLAAQIEQLVSSMPRHVDYLKFALSQTVKRA